MRRTRGLQFAVLLSLTSLCGCCTARFIAVDDHGGVVAIPSNTNNWPTYNRDHAVELMKQKCPNGYVIDHEEEVVSGTRTDVRTQNDQSSVGAVLLGRKQSVTESHDLHEWHITYHAN